MNKSIKLLPSNVEFQLSGRETILNAALSKNVNLEYSCKNGQCGQCKAILLEGSVRVVDELREQVIEHGLAKNEILTCCTRAETNLKIQADYYEQLSHIVKKTIPAKVDSFEYVNDDVLIMILRLPPASQFDFLSGQFIDLIWSGEKRSYSIANSNSNKNTVELHIKKVPGGLFSEHLFNNLKENMLFRINGPLGTFFLRGSLSPVIFMCTGTGFAPIKSMVEKLIEGSVERDIYIYWGGKEIKDLYSLLPSDWAGLYPNIKYFPLCSREGKSALEGIRYIQDLILSQHESLDGFDVYACGSESMIKEASTLLISRGLSSQSFYSDAFVSSNK
jgi:CDP-4-dehydro-6-deoxyglucose reductase, E3